MYCLFFSFKGGVGRTSSLLNTALYLAKHKKRVLIIDLDLAAPGIDIFDTPDEDFQRPSYHPIKCFLFLKEYHIREETGQTVKDIKDKLFTEKNIRGYTERAPKGFVELYLEYQRTGILPEIHYPKPIINERDGEHYIYRLPKKDLGDGDILIMRAGNHDSEEYQDLINEIDYKKLDPALGLKIQERSREPQKKLKSALFKSNDAYSDEILEVGPPPFIYELKRAIQNELMPDYVLVDCRPGNETISKIAMTWLSDSVILTFNLNPWNLNGIIKAYELVINSPCQREHPNILLLASPIPRYAQSSKLYADQYDLIKNRMPNARNNGRGGEGGPIEVPYADILSLRDLLISDVVPNDPACERYEKLGQLIIAGNPIDLENRIRAAKSMGDPDQVIIAFERLFREYRHQEALPYEYGCYLYELGRAKEAEAQLLQAWTILNDKMKDKGEGPDSPYRLDASRQLSRAELSVIRKEFHGYRDKNEPIPYNVIDKSVKKLNTTEERLTQSLKDTAAENSGPIHALFGDLYYLKSECFSKTDRIQYLRDAEKSYNEAIRYESREAHYQYQLGLVTARIATLESDIYGEGYKKAISAFSTAVDLKTENTDALLEWGRHELALALKFGDNPMPLFLTGLPYIDDTRSFKDIVTHGNAEIDVELLKQAEKRFRTVIRQRSHEYFALFHRGLVKALQAAKKIHGSEDIDKKDFENIRDNLIQAILDFNKTSLYQPIYRPAYFYSGMIQFVLESFESKYQPESNAMRKIRFRQAFYRLEHFIDQELERIIPGTDEQREPFYFDPEDIDLILKTPFDFLRTMEERLELPPLTNVIYPEANAVSNQIFIENIRRHTLKKEDG